MFNEMIENVVYEPTSGYLIILDTERVFKQDGYHLGDSKFGKKGYEWILVT